MTAKAPQYSSMTLLVLSSALVLSSCVSYSKCRVDWEQYTRLRAGMSYASVVEILGCHGVQTASSGVAGTETVLYQWRGNYWTGGNMNATFQDGRLVVKGQFGLR